MALEEEDVVIVEAAAADDEEALGNPKAPDAAEDGDDAANEELIDDASWTGTPDNDDPPAAAVAWRLMPDGFIELAEEDFFDVFSFMTEAAAEACRVVDPLPPCRWTISDVAAAAAAVVEDGQAELEASGVPGGPK